MDAKLLHLGADMMTAVVCIAFSQSIKEARADVDFHIARVTPIYEKIPQPGCKNK